jgi:uncharacterized protein (TIRG00374 family)
LKKALLNIVQYTIFIGLGIFLLYLTFRGKNLNEIKDYLLSANYSWLFLSLFIAYIALWVRAYRWNILIEPLGFKPKLINTYHSLTIGYMANYALPRVGEVVRCGTLARVERMPADVLIGTVIAERAFDVLCLFILTIFTILLKLKVFGGFIKTNVLDTISHKVSNTLNFSTLFWLVFLASFLAILILVYVFRQRIRKIVVFKKMADITKGILKGIKTVWTLKRKKAFIFHTFLMWFLYYLMTYLVFFSLPGTSKLSPVDGLFILVLGSYGMAAPVQGGMGTYHAMIFLGLTGLYMIPKEEAVALAVLLHEPQFIGLVIAGAISFFILVLKRREQPQVKIETTAAYEKK